MSARELNWRLWSGLVLSPIAYLSYPFVFERWPVTRDFPWVNLLLFGVAALLLAAGLRRAFAPGRRRFLRITAGVIATTLSVAIFASFVMSVFVRARQLPASAQAPQVGERAPDFTLPDENGAPVLARIVALARAGVGRVRVERRAAGVFDVRGLPGVQFRVPGNPAASGRLHGDGVRPVVISIDPPDVSRALSREAGYTFTFLSDPSLGVIRRYDVANGAEARPAEFLLDSTGIVRWRNLTASLFVRARPEAMLEAVTRLPAVR
jgi:peroxiredoxin